ncbi:MAG: hypothetical protein R2830_10150 [Saprospiraceae bacterium]
MKKLIITFLITTFYNIGNHAFSQSGGDSLLLSLKEELFPFNEDSAMVEIATLCEMEGIENVYTTFVRQPDLKGIVNILRRIVFTKNVSLIPDLEDVRQEYVAYLRKDWEPLFNQKYGSCKVVSEKIQIFQCVEEALLSLNFAKMKLTKQEGFNYYFDTQQRWYKSLNDTENGYKAFEGFRGFSPYYLNLIKNRIAGAPVLNFDFIEPFLEDLKDPLIEYLEKYYVEGLKVQKLELEGYIYFKILNILNEERNPILLNSLVNILIKNKNIDKIEIARNVIEILKNSQPNGLLEKRIKEQLQQPKGEDKMNALLASSYIFRPDFVDFLIGVNNANTLTNEESEYLKRVFEVLNKRPYVSNTQKESIERILKE